MKLQNDLGQDKIPGLVLRLALPTMIAQFVSVLYSIVDRMYIGNIPIIGDAALAGVGVCGPIVTLLSSFGTLVGLGGAPILAMRLGQKNLRGAQAILSNGFALLTVLSVVLSGRFVLFREPLLLLFGASQTTLLYANQYMSIYAAGTIFALLATGLNSFIICQGYSTVAMGTVLIGAVLNIVLDPIFIFALDMGVAGAAIATVLSQMASCAFVVCFLLSKKVPVRITFGGYSWSVVSNILRFGLSPFVIIATDSVLFIVLNMSLKRYGGAQADSLIACGTIVQSFLLLVSMPLGGITGGTQPILSYNYGAGRTDRIRQGVKTILLAAVSFDVLMFILSRFCALPFARIFSADPQVLALSEWGIKIFTLAIIPMAVQYALVDGLTALGVTKVSLWLSVFRKSTFLLSTLLLPVWLGATAVFYAEPVADLLASCVSTAVFLLVFGRVMRQRDAMPEGTQLFGG
ncbi:MAG: MATE family efflux transporter [Angelakisella sp.]